MRDQKPGRPIFEKAVESGLLEGGRTHHDVDVVEMGESKKRLQFADREGAVLHVKPETVVAGSRSVADEGRNVVPEDTGADGFAGTDAGESF
jgi:hypothetical protein